MKIIEISPKKLKPHPKNPRIHPDSAIEKLTQSIKTYGWTNPIIATEDMVILAGHARRKAALKLNLKTVPVVTLPITGAKADAYLIADNRTQEETFWDEAELRALMADISSMIEKESTGDLSITATGFDLDEVEVMDKLLEMDKEIRLDIEAGSDSLTSSVYICPRCGVEN